MCCCPTLRACSLHTAATAAATLHHKQTHPPASDLPSFAPSTCNDSKKEAVLSGSLVKSKCSRDSKKPYCSVRKHFTGTRIHRGFWKRGSPSPAVKNTSLQSWTVSCDLQPCYFSGKTLHFRGIVVFLLRLSTSYFILYKNYIVCFVVNNNSCNLH